MNLPPPDLPPPSLPSPSPIPAPQVLTPQSVQPQSFNPYAPPASAAKVELSPEPDLDFAAGSWGGVLKEALSYPLRPGNRGGLFLAFMVIVFISLVAWIPVAGWIVALGGAAYMSAYYFELIQHTINGKSDVPEWPYASSWWDDILTPGVQMLFITVLSYGIMIFTDWHLTGLLFASLYFPMASLALVCTGNAASALPHQVLPAVVRCLPGYLLCALLFGAMEIGRGVTEAMFEKVPVVSMVLPGMVAIYGMFVQARLAGMIYLRSSEKLPW